MLPERRMADAAPVLSGLFSAIHLLKQPRVPPQKKLFREIMGSQNKTSHTSCFH